MATVSIRDLDDGVRDRLRIRAARNGRSMEAEMRAILTAAVAEPAREYDNPFTMLRDLFLEHEVVLEVPQRRHSTRPAPFADLAEAPE